VTSSEYLQSVVSFFNSRGWKTSPSKVGNGVYLIASRKNTTNGLSHMLVMVVDSPESRVTSDHLEYLFKAGEKRNVESVALTSRIKIPDEVRQSAQDNGITLIKQDTILSETDAETNKSITNQSHSNKTKLDQDSGYEVYGSRVRLILHGLGGLFLGLGGIWLLITGFNANWFATLAVIFCVPLGLVGAGIMFYQAIRNKPILRITNDGISYNKPVGRSKFYSWEEIKKIRCVEQKIERTTQTHLQIQLVEMDTEGLLKEMLAEANKLVIGDEADAHYIPIESFGVNFDEVAEAITQYSDIQVSDKRESDNGNL